MKNNDQYTEVEKIRKHYYFERKKGLGSKEEAEMLQDWEDSIGRRSKGVFRTKKPN